MAVVIDPSAAIAVAFIAFTFAYLATKIEGDENAFLRTIFLVGSLLASLFTFVVIQELCITANGPGCPIAALMNTGILLSWIMLYITLIFLTLRFLWVTLEHFGKLPKAWL